MNPFTDKRFREKHLAFCRRYLREESKAYPEKAFVAVPKDKWPTCTSALPPVAVWRSRHFLVQMHQASGDMVRLSVNRAEIANDGGWRDGITWDELQWIKNAVGYSDHDAVEVFPADADVVNVANMRHLWVFPVGYRLSFAWRDGDKGE